MRCLYCGKRLALLTKLAHGEFCSASHRKLYSQEEQQAALARLMHEQKRVGRSRAPAAPPVPPAAAPAAATSPGLPGFCNCVPSEQIRPPRLFSYIEPIIPVEPPCVLPDETGSQAIPSGLIAIEEPPVQRLEGPGAEPAAKEAEEIPPPAALCPDAPAAVPGEERPVPPPQPVETVPEFVFEFSPRISEPDLRRPDLAASCRPETVPPAAPVSLAKPAPAAPDQDGISLPRAGIRPWIPQPAVEQERLLEAIERTRLARPVPLVGTAAIFLPPVQRPIPIHQGWFILKLRLPEVDASAGAAPARTSLLRAPLRARIGKASAMLPADVKPYVPAGASPAGLFRADLLATPALDGGGGGFPLPPAGKLIALDMAAAVAQGPPPARWSPEPIRTLPPPPKAPLRPGGLASRGAPRLSIQIWLSRPVPQPPELEVRIARVVDLAVPAAVIPRCPLRVEGFGDESHPAACLSPLRLEAAWPRAEAAVTPSWLRPQPPDAIVRRSGLKPDNTALFGISLGPAHKRLLPLSWSAAGGAPRPAATLEALRPDHQPVVRQSRPGCAPVFGPPWYPHQFRLDPRVTLSVPSGVATAPVPAHPEPAPRVPGSRLAVFGIEDRHAAAAGVTLRSVRRMGGFSRFWKVAPADLRWLALALPLVLALAFWGSGRKPIRVVKNGEPRTEGMAAFLETRWETLKENSGQRAAVSLQDDFRAGLGEWEGAEDWGRHWQYDPAGFVLTGPLAIYTPSKRLSDYTFEFLGQIETRSLNWVFRAADLQNYYAMKIVLTNSGPLPEANLVRYAVIHGKAGKPVQTRLPLTVSRDTLYRVQTDVRGADFSVSVLGQMVASWTDDRLMSGGVGFFSDRGERARLRWVQVSHQYDALGRLCAFLAPYPVQASDTGWSGK